MASSRKTIPIYSSSEELKNAYTDKKVVLVNINVTATPLGPRISIQTSDGAHSIVANTSIKIDFKHTGISEKNIGDIGQDIQNGRNSLLDELDQDNDVNCVFVLQLACSDDYRAFNKKVIMAVLSITDATFVAIPKNAENFSILQATLSSALRDLRDSVSRSASRSRTDSTSGSSEATPRDESATTPLLPPDDSETKKYSGPPELTVDTRHDDEKQESCFTRWFCCGS